MQIILLFLIASFTLLSCSSDDDIGNTTDPILGSWDNSGTFDDFFDDEETIPIIINYEITSTFSADGTGSQNFTTSTIVLGEEISDSGTENFTWENTASNPNFDSINQTYRLTFTDEEGEYSILNIATYSSNFMSVTTTDEDGITVEWTKK